MLLTTAAKTTVEHLHQVDQALSKRFFHQVGASSSPLGVIAAPAAVLCGIFGATLLGAVSYRRSARRIARTLEVAWSKLFRSTTYVAEISGICFRFHGILFGSLTLCETPLTQATAAPQPSVPEPSTGPGSPGGLAGPLRAPRATDFLTKGEIMYLFVVPGLPAWRFKEFTVKWTCLQTSKPFLLGLSCLGTKLAAWCSARAAAFHL